MPGATGTTTTGTTTTGTSATAGATGTSATAGATGTTSGREPAGTTTSKTSPTAGGTTATLINIPEIFAKDVYGMFVAIFVFVLSIFVLFSTGSILSVLVLWATIALMLTVLVYYGFLDIQSMLKKVEKELPPMPIIRPSGANLVGSEVFYIRQNQFTYDEAPAVCAAYGAELATLEQVIEAYNYGAEWCGYGWSAGGMALFPTQKSTWEQLQREVDTGKRTRCGRPGVNGGYMDPMLKFGVNCFGFKPKGEFTPPDPVPGTDRQKFDEMVNRFKEMLNTMKLSPFSRREWSGYDSTPTGVVKKATEGFVGTKKNVKVEGFTQSFPTPFGFVETFGNADPTVVEGLVSGGSYAPVGPYGLRGDPGPTGPPGPPGPPGTTTAATTTAATTTAATTTAATTTAGTGALGFCMGLGRPEVRDGVVLRVYTRAECDQLGGRFPGNGECLKTGGGSFSWDCRALT